MFCLKAKNVYDYNKEEDDFEYQVNSYVIVEYEGEFLPGKVMNVDWDGSAEVSAIPMRGADWAWLDQIDHVWYDKDKILEVIEEPQLKPGCFRSSRMPVFFVQIQKYRKH